MNVIWQTKAGLQTEFELQFIDEVILEKVPHRNYYDSGTFQNIEESPIIVYSCDNKLITPDIYIYLKKFEKHFLIHLSNETLGHKSDYYNRAKSVFRSYYDPNINSKNVYFLPLGFQSRFLRKDRCVSFNEKEIAWCFFGQIKSHRTTMLEALTPCRPNFIHQTVGWDTDGWLSIDRQIELYEKTIFVPCPFGNVNPDSFRIMEALEWGCIPVCVKLNGIDYYKFVYGDHPFILGDDWQDASNQMLYLLNNKELLHRRQTELNLWYETFKANLATDVASIIRAESHPVDTLLSPQFAYQRLGKNKYFVRFLFALHFDNIFLFRLIRKCRSVLNRFSGRAYQIIPFPRRKAGSQIAREAIGH